MATWEKLRAAVLSGRSDSNIDFDKLCARLRVLGFSERVNASHHIFTHDAVVEIINLQSGSGGNAKPYQVKQVRALWNSTRFERLRVMDVGAYRVTVTWSDADKAFIAEVPELPGCMADGKTEQEARANVRVIAREWIETAHSLGRTVPEPKALHVTR